jgi:hypothetical protein
MKVHIGCPVIASQLRGVSLVLPVNHLDPIYLFLGIPARSKEEKGAVNQTFFGQIPNG